MLTRWKAVGAVTDASHKLCRAYTFSNEISCKDNGNVCTHSSKQARSL